MNTPSLFGRARAASLSVIVLGLLATSVVGLHARPAPRPAPQDDGRTKTATSGNAEKGKKIFTTVGCWECHGFMGQGGNGARIGPPPLALAAFLTYVRHPKGQMPPYEIKVISDADLTDIYAYLQTIPKPPPAKDIPLLNN